MRVLTHVHVVKDENAAVWEPDEGVPACVLPRTPVMLDPKTPGVRQGGTGAVFGALLRDDDDEAAATATAAAATTEAADAAAAGRREAGRRVAVKVPFASPPSQSSANSPEPIAQFFCNELRVYARLLEWQREQEKPQQHLTHVALPIGVCSVCWADGNGEGSIRDYDQPMRPGFVIEWLGPSEGEVERPLAKANRWLDPKGGAVAEVFKGMATGVAQLHAAGVVHYDIKTGAFQLIGAAQGGGACRMCKVFDLSHAKLVSGSFDADQRHRPNATQRPNYPHSYAEASTIAAATPWLDVYALGSVYFEILDRFKRHAVVVEYDAKLRELALEMQSNFTMTAESVVEVLEQMMMK